MLGHEVDRVGSRHLGGDDEIAFVLAILVVHQNEHAAVLGLVDDFLDARQKRLFHLLFLSDCMRPRKRVITSISRLTSLTGASVSKQVTCAVCGMTLIPNRPPPHGRSTQVFTVRRTPAPPTDPYDDK